MERFAAFLILLLLLGDIVAAVPLTLASINLRLERNSSTYTGIKSSPSMYLMSLQSCQESRVNLYKTRFVSP